MVIVHQGSRVADSWKQCLYNNKSNNVEIDELLMIGCQQNLFNGFLAQLCGLFCFIKQLLGSKIKLSWTAGQLATTAPLLSPKCSGWLLPHLTLAKNFWNLQGQGHKDSAGTSNCKGKLSNRFNLSSCCVITQIAVSANPYSIPGCGTPSIRLAAGYWGGMTKV